MKPSPAFPALAEAAGLNPPEAAFVLGSGMGAAVDRLEGPRSVPFLAVPGLSAPTIPGHRGRLTAGTWAGKPVVVFEGRLHFYEGHPWRQVIQPIQVAAHLGARVLVCTNAAGGIADALEPGSLMVIRDHVEWNRAYCWRHPGPGGIGPPRPSPYSPRLVQLLTRADGEPSVRQGIYASVTGPCYETPAEIRALRACGADAVGMSTTREIQAGFDLGLECAAVSCITNRAAGLSKGIIDHEEVLANAALAADRLANLLETFLRLL
jgi:purine-nucleoside phosphorylase